MRRHGIGVALTLICAAAAWAQDPAVTMRGLWVLPGTSVQAQHLQVSVEHKDSYAEDVIPFDCKIDSEWHYPDARLHFQVRDAKDVLVHEAELPLDIPIGASSDTVIWDSAALSTGVYQATVDILFDQDLPPASCMLTIKKVTDAQLKADLEAVAGRIAELRGKMVLPSTPGMKPSYAEVRLRIAEDFIAPARAYAQAGEWRRMDALLEYLQRTAGAVYAWQVFGAAAPELEEPVPDADMMSLTVKDGVFCAGDRPAFLFGRVLSKPTPELLEQLHRYGLNFAAFNIAPSDTLASASLTADFQPRFDALFGKAAEANLGLSVGLASECVPEWVLAASPGLNAKGFFDLTEPAAREALRRHINAAVPYLARQKAVKAVTIADNPRFKFNSEEVRNSFIESVKKTYPDRQRLNQAWRAHLAKYEEITIWDDTAKQFQYQNRRAYQYDWQIFQRGLVQDYFRSVQAAVNTLAPGLLQTAVLPDSVFEAGETRFGVEREALANMMDASACTSTVSSKDDYYAFSYSNQGAFHSVTSSFQPGKPMFDLGSFIDIEGIQSAGPVVNSILWEEVMNGVDALALASDSTIFESPDALESFADVCLAANRLAPVISAFQQAPIQVAILYSDSAKILDEGVPYLKSARYAYEGCSFAGYRVRYITEKQIEQGGLDGVKVFVIPETPAVADAAFSKMSEYIEHGGSVIRVGTPIPYDPHGFSRRDVLRDAGKTIRVRGLNLPTEYLHAMDAVITDGALPQIPRTVNTSGYPVEGVKTLYAEYGGHGYLFLINVRKDAVTCQLTGAAQAGRDLILGRDVKFPVCVQPLDPMLIRLDQLPEQSVTAVPPGQMTPPTAKESVKRFLHEWTIP